MKITKISTHMLGVTRPRPGAGMILRESATPGSGDSIAANPPVRNWIFVRVETDEGITGIGEATTEMHEHAVVAMIDHHFAPMLIGRDPTQINRLWQEMRRMFWWRDGVVAASACSGLEMAMWDITGKALGQPVYKLLGGAVRDKVKLYARNDLALGNAVLEIKAAMNEGYQAFKTGPSPYHQPYDEEKQVDSAIEMATAMRAAAPECDLMMDCLGNFSMHAAHRLIDGLSNLRMLFVEEPVNADTPRHLVELRRAFPGTRIAAGERLMTRWGSREWLELGAVDVLQPDICHCGGISELMRIAAHAETYNVAIAPHNPNGPVALAANAHACIAMQNFLILEHWRDHNFVDKLPIIGPRVESGCIAMDDRPGLGVELDWDFITRHPYNRLYTFHFNDKFGGMASI